jgi:catechol 2,3-dioxygenase-like lactoylglutathione lyase family enzyme
MVMGSQPPLANTVTLGVQDFSRERDFYQRLGWPVVFESDGFTVFQLRGAGLALFQLGQLARDAHAGRADQRRYPERSHHHRRPAR